MHDTTVFVLVLVIDIRRVDSPFCHGVEQAQRRVRPNLVHSLIK